jgi:hypothetical protein
VGVIFARARDAGWKAPRRAAAVDTPDQAVTIDDLARIDADLARYDGIIGGPETAEEVQPEWPAPQIPGALSTPDVPADLLPGVWGQMAQAVSESTQTPAVMSVLCALGVLGALLQNRYIVDTGSHQEVLAIWTKSISASGTRKVIRRGRLSGSVARVGEVAGRPHAAADRAKRGRQVNDVEADRGPEATSRQGRRE